MSFILSNILLPFIPALFVGLPLSIYAGFICGRILIFEEIKNKLTEIIYLNSGPFEISTQINTSYRNIDAIEIIDQRLENLGHKAASEVVSEIYFEMRSELSELESHFTYCETRHKRDPKNTMIENDKIRRYIEKVFFMKPSIKHILTPGFKI